MSLAAELLPARSDRSASVEPGLKLRPSFRLIRYFSLTSLVGVLIVLAVLVFIYRHFAFVAMEAHETRNNEALTQVFANTLWREHASFVQNASSIGKADLRRHPEIFRIRKAIIRQMSGLNVVKVKIYNLDGLTVFSTDPKQIGEDKSTNIGFLSAKNGKIASDITFRNQFDAFEHVISNRNLVFSYVPIRVNPDSPVEGVMEVYSDVTHYVRQLERTALGIVIGVLSCLSLLYIFLFSIVRRADGIITAQNEEMRLAHEEIIRHQSRHDSLTGLPNRLSFSEHLDKMIKGARRLEAKCALIYLGLDGFREIHDSMGYVARDKLLKETSSRLRQCLRDADITARISGDEFAVGLSGISGEKGVERVVVVADRIRNAIANQPFVIDSHDFAVTTSIGIAVFPDNGNDVVELMKSANAALHHARSKGRNSYQFHTADMNQRAFELLLLERDLRQALDQNQFVLHYQPQVDLRTGNIIGAEALIRWEHPERGMVSPGDFIPVAEDRGLIVPIGEWVLEEACRQNKEWQELGLSKVVVAVNLSALQFQKKNLWKVIAGRLKRHALDPELFELELTESSIMRDAEASIATMDSLKQVGVKLSLDDFGTGYSSMNQLKRLPLDKLKIDQSFVRGLPHDQNDLAIARAIIAMGKAMNLKTIAEGVETKAQLDVLKSLDCDEMQGFYMAKPMPASGFVEFMRERKAV